MGDRHLPLRPDPERLAAGCENEAARDARAADFGFESWARLETAAELSSAIHRNDTDAVVAMIERDPALRDANVLGPDSNWGPPMSHAANLGHIEIVRALHDRGATDVQWAFDRACLQGQVELARELASWGAVPEPGAVMGPAETLSPSGLEFLLDLGAEVADEHGNPLAPVALLLETYARRPAGKHACLQLLVDRGLDLPDTPVMALHRGDTARLAEHVRADPGLLTRTFDHDDIYPLALGCHEDRSLALHGTPIAGGTLLHIAVDFDETSIVDWLLEAGADPREPAAVDVDGFGGHTALYGTVVSQSWRVGQRRDDAMARRLLDAGATADVRASLRKRLRFVADENEHEYRDVSPVEWGRNFHDQSWVNRPVLALLEATT